jgi:hypothetical protein
VEIIHKQDAIGEKTPTGYNSARYWLRWHTFCPREIMTVLDALAGLETATLECKQRPINTPEVREALDFLQARIRPEWLIPQFRYHAQLVNVDKEAQQQALLAVFPVIRKSVKDLLGKQMDALAWKFAANHEIDVKNELECLVKDYRKLQEPWVFVPR